MSLYNRSLLTKFAIDDITTLLGNAHEFIQEDALGLSATLKQALSTRLKLRTHLLAAVDVDQQVDKGRSDDWKACIELLSTLKETNKLGKPVNNSFSIKLQRKLASTVPPRPIVDVSFDNAWDLLSQICACGRDAYLILDYRGGSQLQVRKALFKYYDLELKARAELHMVLSITNATAASLHPLSPSVAHIRRHESAWQHFSQAGAPRQFQRDFAPS